MEQAKRVARRMYDAQLKQQVLAACAAPGASVARIALEHGLNVTLVHRWRRIAEGRERGAHARPAAAGRFVSLPIAAPLGSAPAEIRIELKRGATSVNVTWPMTAAAECARWLRELLR
jgi:transposase